MPYVVVTREPDAAAPYATVLAAFGLETIAMPVTRSEPPRDPGALPRALEVGGYAAILVASPRAASALLAASAHPPCDVWAIGLATARVLEAAGVSAIVPSQVRDGASAARAMLAAGDLVGKKLLVPHAEHGRDEAIAILRDAGVEVDAVVAYRTVAVAGDEPAIARGRELLADGAAALCVVFAPSQVAALDALVGVRAIATRWVAIGDTTAAALRERGVVVAGVAETPTPEGIANAVAAVYPPRR